MASEYIGSRTVRSLLTKLDWNELRWGEREKMMLELLEACRYMHEKGVCHHDLKPENILLSDHGSRVCVVDFGMATLENSSFRRQGKGTLQYAPPEAFHNEMCLVSDIWSLGIMFYEICSHGELPFDGRNEQDLRKNIKMRQVEAFRPRFKVPNVWERIICEGMLDKNPQKRLTAEQIIRTLASHNISLHSHMRRHVDYLEEMRRNEFGEPIRAMRENNPATSLNQAARSIPTSALMRGMFSSVAPRTTPLRQHGQLMHEHNNRDRLQRHVTDKMSDSHKTTNIAMQGSKHRTASPAKPRHAAVPFALKQQQYHRKRHHHQLASCDPLNNHLQSRYKKSRELVMSSSTSFSGSGGSGEGVTGQFVFHRSLSSLDICINTVESANTDHNTQPESNAIRTQPVSPLSSSASGGYFNFYNDATPTLDVILSDDNSNHAESDLNPNSINALDSPPRTSPTSFYHKENSNQYDNNEETPTINSHGIMTRR